MANTSIQDYVSAQRSMTNQSVSALLAMNASQQKADITMGISNSKSDMISALTSRITKIGADIKQQAGGN